MRHSYFSCLFVLFSLLCSFVFADELRVGSGQEFGSIQAGIDAAVDGDEVVIADGTYTGDGNRDIDFKGKAITVRSENGPDVCIIDCEKSGQGFNFHSGEDESSILDGVTITNGYAIQTGGINCDSSPLIRNCRLVRNQLFTVRTTANPQFIDCEFIDNFNDNFSNIYSPLGNPIFIGCRFVDSGLMIGSNNSQFPGKWKGIIRNCVFDIRKEPIFSRLAAVESKVGYYQTSGELIIENSVFYCTFGIYLTHQTYAPGVEGVIRNNVFVSSDTGAGVGIMYRMSKSKPLITGNIITGFEKGILFTYKSSFSQRMSNIRYNNVWGNTYNCWLDAERRGVDLSGLVGHMSEDPLFVNPSDGDYRLFSDSPCIDRGDPDFVAGEGETDFWGNARVKDGDVNGTAAVDIGAFEYDPWGKFCAVGWRGEFGRIDLSTGEGELLRTDLPERLQALSWSPDGILYAGKTNNLFTLDPHTGDTEHVLSFSSDIRGMAFSSWGQLYVTAGSSLRIIDLQSGGVQEQGTLWGDAQAAQGLAFSPEGVLYGIHPYDHQANSYDLFTINHVNAQMRLIGSFEPTTAGVNQSIAFTDDGRLFAIGRDVFTQLDPSDGSIIGSPIEIDGDFRGLAVVWMPSNQIPVADAGADVEVYSGIGGVGEVLLDGSGSFDADGEALTYLWSWEIDGEVLAADGEKPTVEFPRGEHVVTLVVDDGSEDSLGDEVIVKVLNVGPVCNAGEDSVVYAGVDGLAEVLLDGSGSSDVNGDELEYRWYIGEELVGEGVNPTIDLEAGSFLIELVVSDGIDEAGDEVVVEVVGAIEVGVRIVPGVINLSSRGRRVLAMVELPEGIIASDIDGEYGVVFGPGEIEARFWRVLSKEGSYRLIAMFDRGEVVDAVGDKGGEVNVTFRLVSGEYVYGSDTVKVVGKGKGNSRDSRRGRPERNK